MDKDNLEIQRILNGLTKDTLQNLKTETYQQLISALCLTVIGLLLACAGLVGLTLKLGKIVAFYIIVAARSVVVGTITRLSAPRQVSSKIIFSVADKL